MQPGRLPRLLALLVLLAAAGEVRASVSLLLEQPYGGLGAWNPTGHSALYFDHICAATPVELRPCGPGELGVVISRYDGIGRFDWVAVPLVPYLYAVEQTSEIPASAERLQVLRMRDVYRREHLEMVAPDTEDGGMPAGNWYELAGSAYDRTIYGFRVKTTPGQDAGIIALFNDRPDVTRYDGAFRNCADFARVTIDRLYPHALRRNFIADFGLTTPKSVARGLAHYAAKHPETEFDEFRIPQVPGDLPRSVGVEGVTESLLRRYGVPLALLSPQATAAVLVAYVGHGRFAEPKHAPELDLPAMEAAAEAEAASEAARHGMPLQTAGDGAAAPAVGLPVSSAPAADRAAMPTLPVLGNSSPAVIVGVTECPQCLGSTERR